MFKKTLLAVSLMLIFGLSGCGGGSGNGNINSGNSSELNDTQLFKQKIPGAWLSCQFFQSTYNGDGYTGELYLFKKESGLSQNYDGGYTVITLQSFYDDCTSPFYVQEVYYGSYKIENKLTTQNGVEAFVVTFKERGSEDPTGNNIITIQSDYLYYAKTRSDGSFANEMNFDEGFLKVPTESYSLYGINN